MTCRTRSYCNETFSPVSPGALDLGLSGWRVKVPLSRTRMDVSSPHYPRKRSTFIHFQHLNDENSRLAHTGCAAGDEGQQAPQDGTQAHNGNQERKHARCVQFPGRRHG